MSPAQQLTIKQALSRAKKAAKQGNLAVAQQLYQAVLQQQPRHPIAKKGLRKLQKQLLHHQPLPIQTADPSPDQINALINLYYSGQLTKAEQACRELLETYPESLIVLNVLSATLAGQGQLQQAVRLFDKLIQLKPDDAQAYNNRGNVLIELGQLEAAMDSYDQAIQLKPDDAEAYSNRGNALTALGQPEEAVRNCDRAIEIKPDFAEAYYNRGVALTELGQLEAAMDSCNRAIELKPDYAEVQYNRHAILLNPNDLMPAIKCMEKAIDIDPLNTRFRFILGVLWDYLGDTQEATAHFDIVENGANLYRSRLDAWRYIKSVNKKGPTIIGSHIDAFKLGIDAAIVDGLVLEFGVRFGTSIRQICALVDQNVHGFDSFQGLPESWHNEPKGSYSTKGTIPSVPQNVILHVGWFEETLPGFVKRHPEPVRFMNIDCDIYSSTKTVLEFLAKQIIPGTVIVFDEYIGNEYWREDEFKAFQEAVLKYGWKYEYLCFSFMTKQVVVRIIGDS